METTIYEVGLIDGRTFRIFCANSTQKRKFRASMSKIKHIILDTREITNGIHTMKQWNEIVETL